MFEFATSIFIIAIAGTFFLITKSRRSEVPSAVLRYGPVDETLQCPACGKAGAVHTRTVHRKAGISNGKVMAGMLTGGLALLMVGLHRHEPGRESHCMRCEATWDPDRVANSAGATTRN